MKPALLLLLTLVFKLQLNAQNQFDFDSNCKEAQEAILSLEFKKAKTLLLDERKTKPSNLIPFYLDNYIDFLTIVISEEKTRFERLKGNKEIRLDLLKKGDQSSPFYLLIQAEINLQWAFARVKFNEYLTAALEVNKAYRLLEENQKKFPDFILNKKCLGLLHAAVGTIPDEYQWAIKLFGFEGSIKKGEEEVIEFYEFVSKHPLYSAYSTEAELLLSVLELNLLNEEKFVKERILKAIANERNPNPLQVFCFANSCMKMGQTDEAIDFLNNYKPGKSSFPFYYLSYMLGQAKLSRLDADANLPLEHFLKNFKGINFIKAANLRLAWFNYLKGDLTKYNYYLQRSASSGAAIVDEDKQAKHESAIVIKPVPALLKARLLFDGGYYERALKELSTPAIKKIKSPRDNLELIYRMARIYHKQNNLDKAIGNYELTIKNGAGYPYYFAANSALQLGLIYEEKKNYDLAKKYFSQALELKTQEYRNSISQKAKSGLNRLENL